MRVTILGCGGSSGVPVIGNNWGSCDPAEPKNRRLRPSALVQGDDGTSILIDTTPDLREQLLRADVRRIDAVLYTHAHADHSHGIDELREVCRLMGGPVRAFGEPKTMSALEERFHYCFRPLSDPKLIYRPVLEACTLDGPFNVGSLRVVPFEQDHGYSISTGYRIGGFAYSTDVVRLDERAFAVLEGVDVWVVDCVRIEPPHPVHAHLPLTLEWIERVRPRRAILTHMNHSMDYATLLHRLPPGVEPGFDGMEVEVAPALATTN